MIRFAHPEWLNLLWIVPILAAAIIWDHRRRKAAMHLWAERRLWDAALPGAAAGRAAIKSALLTAAAGLLIIAVAGPRVGTRLAEVKRRGVDLAIAIDVSASMQAEDISPSRLTRAKLEIEQLLANLRGDRVALVPFAAAAFVQVPLTLDYAAVISVLKALEPGFIPHPGTAIGEAIRQAQRAFRPQGEGEAQRVLLLISDGEDHEERAVEQARAAANEGIVIFTIGMASPGGAPIPLKSSSGRITGYKKDRNGETVVSRLNEPLLSDIAAVAGGNFWRATSSGDEFRQFLAALSRMKSEEFETKQFTDYEDRFQWPAGLAMALIIIAELMSSRRKIRLTKALIALGALALTLAWQNSATAAGPRSVTKRGIKEYQAGEFDKALADFLEARAADGESPLTDYNLGTTLYKMDNFAGAMSALNRAADGLAPETASRAWFNLGNALFKENKLKEAVEAYKNALKLNHKDEDAKVNLETALRMLQMPPPQQPQPQPNGRQDSTRREEQQPQQQAQQDQSRQKEEQQQQQTAARNEGAEPPKDGKQPQGQMSPAEALQLLEAMEGDEQEAQKEKLKREFGEPRRAEKDW